MFPLRRLLFVALHVLIIKCIYRKLSLKSPEPFLEMPTVSTVVVVIDLYAYKNQNKRRCYLDYNMAPNGTLIFANCGIL